MLLKLMVKIMLLHNLLTTVGTQLAAKLLAACYKYKYTNHGAVATAFNKVVGSEMGR